MEYLILGLFLLTGAVAGFLAGLLGIGGGLIIVPALVFVFHLQDLSEAIVMHMAIGTSLATVVITAASSVYAHHRRGAVLWPAFLRLTPGLVIGALLGAAIADLLPGDVLRIVFGSFVLIMAAQLAFGRPPEASRQLPSVLGMGTTGGGIGLVSALLGIGGGTMMVPFLAWCNVPIRNAVATSSAGGLSISIAGAIGFAVTGWFRSGAYEFPAWSSGYIYWPAFVGIVAASIPLAPLGAQLAHTIPTGILRKVFAVLLVVIGVRMLAGGF